MLMLMRMIINSNNSGIDILYCSVLSIFTVPLLKNVETKKTIDANDNNYHLHWGRKMYNSVKTPIHIKY
jgi:hypothetical protein